jgi:acyl-coenzyme A synthetase/AMP-(fatty) acid ligase
LNPNRGTLRGSRIQPTPFVSVSAFARQIFAYHRGRAVSRQEFQAQAAALAAVLPSRRYVINFCEDRYLFGLAFRAALARGQVTLLPPDRSTRSLRLLEREFPGALLFHDGEPPAGLNFDSFRVEPSLSGPAYGVSLPEPEPEPGQPALIAFTSGSTGQPQAHPKTWGSLRESARLIQSTLGLEARQAVVATVPPQHMYGLELSVLLPLCSGLAMDSAKPFFPADIAGALAAVPEPRVLVTTPVHLQVLAAAGVSLPELDCIVSATAPLDAGLAADCERRFHTRLLEIYGCTEAGSIAARRTIEEADWTLFANIRLFSDGPSSRVESPHLPQPVQLADVVEMAGERRFRLLGRTADLVNIAGKRHSLGALSRVLTDIEGVVDGAFFLPEADAGRTSRLVAFAVAPGLSAEAIQQRLREQLDPVFVPRRVYLLDSLPRNAIGKLTRRALEELLEAQSPSAGR